MIMACLLIRIIKVNCIIIDFAYKALQPPRHGEIPTHRRIDDGSTWVQRNLEKKEAFWCRFGFDYIPIEETEAALSKLTIFSFPGDLTTHHFDYHPQDDDQQIAITIC